MLSNPSRTSVLSVILLGCLIFLGGTSSVLSQQSTYPGNDYYHGNYRDRETLTRDHKIAKSIIEALESRYQVAELAAFAGPFIPMGSAVPFERIQKLFAGEPLLCEVVQSEKAFVPIDLTWGSEIRSFLQMSIAEPKNRTDELCAYSNIVLGQEAPKTDHPKLVREPFTEAQTWINGQLSGDAKKRVNRVKVRKNKRGELVEVKIYELERGLNALFLKYFPGLQHPAPNGKHDRLTVTYNFVFRIGVVDE